MSTAREPSADESVEPVPEQSAEAAADAALDLASPVESTTVDPTRIAAFFDVDNTIIRGASVFHSAGEVSAVNARRGEGQFDIRAGLSGEAGEPFRCFEPSNVFF